MFAHTLKTVQFLTNCKLITFLRYRFIYLLIIYLMYVLDIYVNIINYNIFLIQLIINKYELEHKLILKNVLFYISRHCNNGKQSKNK